MIPQNSSAPGGGPKKRRVLLPNAPNVGMPSSTTAAMHPRIQPPAMARQPGTQASHPPPAAPPRPSAEALQAIFGLVIEPPPELTRLCDCQDLAMPHHAQMLLQSLPLFPESEPEVATDSDLADALGFVEVEEPDLGYNSLNPDEEGRLTEEVEQQLLREIKMKVASPEAITFLDVAASRWEAKVREVEEGLRHLDWSFERRLLRFHPAILAALHQQDQDVDVHQEEELDSALRTGGA
eukprot:TRINITY_DN48135_c0_g1_i1.p1 TRINITY_DN48135_c0_g1~~TRINITY_DN48135_c0_g1_i1.p1  ORF type:complete len:238 (-),score=56.96 TRINITY_DN48135_c0_g1_i1:35-748(-)